MHFGHLLEVKMCSEVDQSEVVNCSSPVSKWQKTEQAACVDKNKLKLLDIVKEILTC